ncbi:MAG: hypothetical protein KF730_00345 [Sphingomonas sp.]|uniref:hypothetical protein n=1 Tax=Sphingomonas sp. TaxID=28214 RepID=UPI0025D800C1|nr:hypothetical protein [Sphingomonas sp.]MBX3563001.1 hypothetical protein [Sphingomonas sp.]
MRFAALGLTMLLAACGGGAKTSGTSDPAAQNVAAAAAEGTPANQTAAVECGKKPDFVPVYGDAKITICTSDGGEGGQQSGTIIYTTAAAPNVALAWSREQANASGLGQRLLTDKMYSAGETTKRSLMVLVEPEGSGTRVTINWGKL